MAINKYLYSRDSKGKIRVLIISVCSGHVVNGVGIPNQEFYRVTRKSGLLDGALIEQPELNIKVGKAGRTIKAQTELQINSIINKQRDKGYKLLAELTSGDVDPMDYATIDSLLPTLKTYTNGQRKLMLAKDPKPGKMYFSRDRNQVAHPTAKWHNWYWASRKLDGIRAGVLLQNSKFVSFSRTGKSLDVAFTDIFREFDLVKISNILGEDKMIDGELYVHGKRLQEISSMVSPKTYDPDKHGKLEFWIFDYADETSTAEERAKKLNAIVPFLKGTKIKINIQTRVYGYEAMKVLHDKWLTEGFEGLIARKEGEVYGYGKRDDRMIKLKEFQDAEFEIVSYKLGLRGAEDMVFVCKTEDGKEFEAKPIGDRQVKMTYVADMPNLIGKMLTVKFFNYTEDEIPCLPVGVCIRDYE